MTSELWGKHSLYIACQGSSQCGFPEDFQSGKVSMVFYPVGRHWWNTVNMGGTG